MSDAAKRPNKSISQNASAPRVAIIGAGISGLGAARILGPHCEVHVFESASYAGGHACTADTCDGPVDMGFIVFNEENYPLFTELLADLSVETVSSPMSFSVRDTQEQFQWGSDSLASLYASPGSLRSLSHHRFVARLFRFFLRAKRDVGKEWTRQFSLHAYLAKRRVPADVVAQFVEPLACSLWSMSPSRIGDFPADTFLRYLSQHGMFSPFRPLSWRTVARGARAYVDALVTATPMQLHLRTAVSEVVATPNGAIVATKHERQEFDQVIFATHANVTQALLAKPTAAETHALGSFSYSDNEAWLHTDSGQLPAVSAARASWNYLACPGREQVTVTYWMNRLQSLPSSAQYLVTLNPQSPIADRYVLKRHSFAHPVFDFQALQGQARIAEIQGKRNLYHCGAHLGFGFHEDGLRSGYAAARMVLEKHV